MRGVGCIPFHNKMEDAATAEISRVQAWQWIRHQSKTVDGTLITGELVSKIIDEESKKLASPNLTKLKEATELTRKLVLSDSLREFLTSAAYSVIVQTTNNSTTSARL
eukprot:c18671_g1_i1.p1 GENE.c18671_g1_i1~~c18671_g1_i1.p1  ORF type:complete len:108 (+),score=43.68 c18671_g1_i1:78-401(+)